MIYDIRVAHRSDIFPLTKILLLMEVEPDSFEISLKIINILLSILNIMELLYEKNRI